MTRSTRTPLVLALVLALGMLAVLAMVLDGSRSSEPPATGLLGTVPPPTPAAGEAGPGGSPSSSATTRARSAADESGQGLQVDPHTASWVVVSLVLPSGTPPDEEARLLAASFGADDAGRMARYLARRGAPPPTEQRPWEVACERLADGHYRAPFAPGATARFLRLDGRYVYVATPTHVDLGADSTSLEPELGTWITGRLEPAPKDGEVWLRDGYGRGAASAGVRVAHVAGDGSFEHRGVPPERAYSLFFESDTFAPVIEGELLALAGEHWHRDFVLQPGARVEGRVIDAAGSAVAGALVRAETLQLPHYLRAERAAVTAADGRFVLRGLTPGPIRLSADRESHAPAMLDLGALAEGQEATGVELRLTDGARLAGVVRWPDGSPAADAAVTVGEKVPYAARTAWRGYEDRVTRTDPDGRFEVAGLGSDAVVVRASKAPPEGGAAWRARAERAQPGAPVALTLEAPLKLAGRVVDDRGKPVREFTLRVEEERERHAGEGVHSDETLAFEHEAGRFELGGLAAGEWRITADAAGHATSETAELRLPDEAGPLRFVLPRAAGLAGTVEDPRSRPIQGARVTIARAGGRSAWRVAPVFTDAAGRFAFSGLAPGETEITADHRLFGATGTVLVYLTPEETVAGVRLQLRAAGRLTGEVYGPDGAPAANQEILVFGDEQESATAHSDALGRFEVDGLAPGMYMAAIFTLTTDEPAEGSVAPVEIVAHRTAHVVLGVPAVSSVLLRGRVTSAGRGLPAAEVLALRVGASLLDGLRRTESGADGEYALRLGRPGTYAITVQPTGGDPRELNAIIPNVAEHRLDLALPAGLVSGRVTGPTGAPVAGARVSCTDELGSWSALRNTAAETRTDGEGRFELPHLRAGSYTLRVASDGSYGAAVRAGVRVEQGATVVDVELAEAGRILGFVRTEDGHPASGAAVFVRAESGALTASESTVSTDETGQFEAAGLAPGTYTLSARRGKLATLASEPVRVDEGGVAAVELFLEPGTRLRLRVEDPAGNPVAGAVRVLDEHGLDHASMENGEDSGSANTFLDEELTVGPLPAGTYRVFAADREGRTAERTVRAAGEAELALTLRLDP